MCSHRKPSEVTTKREIVNSCDTIKETSRRVKLGQVNKWPNSTLAR
jgi:hypothetical protein